jgi:sulfur-oxidizing protein SoxY
MTSAGAMALATGAGLLNPVRALAAWPQKAFDAENVNAALDGLAGSTEVTESSDIKLKAPDIAENGAVVPITVETSLPGVESISIITEQNPAPLSASYDLGPMALGYVSTRIKMGETSNVMALVKSEGKLYSAVKEIKVTIGGCGG